MKYQFSGPLAPIIERHLELQRSLGLQQNSAAYTLAAFDRHLIRQFPQARTVTRSMVIDFLKTISHVQHWTRRQRLGNLRQLCRFLFQLDGECYIPDSGLLAPATRTFKPYLYTASEVVALMSSAQQLRPIYPLRAESCETLIGLLWVTGIRIGEALRLNLTDVDLVQGLLQIHQTKFYKSRLVPLSSSTVGALESYSSLRTQCGNDMGPTAPFFVGVKGRRWGYETFKSIFSRLVRELGLKTERGSSPRLHDLRHSFATRSLTNLYKTGKDPTAYLPVLATYMGHARVADTSLYLHPGIDLLETAGTLFKAYVQKAGELSAGRCL
jgi:integrase/recombinase XerD